VGWSDFAGQARLLAVDAFRAIAEESVQFHGGIGFTWEHDCHLFLKRALMNEMLGETPEQVRDRVAPGILTRALARGV
jgi:alkylation response protein AidB-like acyl-CoA dehydrogenase